ncbi:MAG TPA: ABC transporter permease subunit, partial [Steroidobacteraceae bacterium]
IVHYDLLALPDDRGFFPNYDSIFICRASVADDVKQTLQVLEDSIDAQTMAALNAQAKLDRLDERYIAQRFAAERFNVVTSAGLDTRMSRIWQRTREHLGMVAVSLMAAILIAVPLGIAAFRNRNVARVAFAIADVLQTVPALALLVFLIPWLGIGYGPAIVALFLYSVLPILRNTHAGLADIGRDLRESAEALGLSAAAQLRHIELPLAARSIIAGIRTAAVINIGTATLGALIGAGGYGQPILAGIRLDDLGLILEGAIPAALLALLTQGLFGALERRVVKAK